MKQIKLILYYTVEFLLAFFLFIGIILCIGKITILTPSYLTNKMEQNKYYEQVYKSMQEEMENYIIQSGLPKEVLDNIYTEGMLKKEINKYINAFYSGEVQNIDTKTLEENLEKNIETYLQNNNIRITDKEAISNFITQIAEVYKTEIIQSESILKIQSFMPKIRVLVNIMIIGILIISMLLILFIKFGLKSKIKCISFFTTAFLLLISYYFITENIDIKNITILTDYTSVLIKDIITNILSLIRNTAVIIIIVSIIAIITSNLLKKKKEFELEN